MIHYGADMKNSVHTINKKHHVYILGKDFTQGLQYGVQYMQNMPI